MSTTTHAVRLGMSRGRTEFTKSLKAPADIGYYVVGTGIFLTVMLLNRDNEVEGTGLTLGVLMLPGVLGMVIVFGAAFGLATAVSTEREDGTLLRAKSVPHGMVGYVVGQVTRATLELTFNLTILLVPAMIILDSLWVNGLRGALLALAIVLLGLAACARRCCPTALRRSRSQRAGGTSRRSPCWAHGRWSGSCSRRSSFGGWRGVSPDRRWPPGATWH